MEKLNSKEFTKETKQETTKMEKQVCIDCDEEKTLAEYRPGYKFCKTSYQ